MIDLVLERAGEQAGGVELDLGAVERFSSPLLLKRKVVRSFLQEPEKFNQDYLRKKIILIPWFTSVI